MSEPTVSLRDLLAGVRGPLTGSCPLTLSDYVEEIVASGFPAMRPLVGRPRRFQLDSYLHNAVDRDVPEQGLAVRKPEAMLKWLRAYAAATAATASYHEVDLVVVRDDSRALAVEVKLANTVTDSDTKHLHWLADRMGDQLVDAIVVNTGPNAYRRPDGIGVVPLGLLAP